MKRILIGVIIMLAFSLSLASSQTMLGAIQSEYQSGKISFDQAMLYKCYAVLDHQRLPARFQELEPPRSGTYVLTEIYQNWDQLSQRTQVTLRTLLVRPSGLPNTYDTSHFRFHYTLTGDDAVSGETYVHNMATRFEDAYDFLVDSRQYYAPPSDGSAGGNSKYDVYIKSLPSGVLGYTQPEVAGSYPWDDATSYIAMRNSYYGYGPELPTIEVTSVHEYFHAVQFAYSYNQPGWIMEVSSVWIEDEMYPANDDEHYYLSEFFDYPHISITRQPSDPTYGLHCYASYIFAQYISEAYADSAMRQIWEDNRYSSVLTSIQNVMSGYGSSRTNAFAEFWVWNYFTGPRHISGLYPEGADYPTVEIERTHSSYPANGSSSHSPEALASNYIVFNIPSGASGPFSITFDGADAANWVVQLVIPESGTYDVRRMSLNAYGYGYLTLEESEYSGHTSVILVIGNVSTSGGGANYTYHADFEEVGPSYDPPLNLVAESGHSGEVPLTWDPPIGGGVGGTVELSNDDGTPASYIPWDLTAYGYGYVDLECAKFNAASDCTLKQVKVYFWGSDNITFHIVQDDGGMPGTDFTGSPFTASVTDGDWTTIDISGDGIPLPAGDFWITYERTADMPACAVDSDTSAGNPNAFHDNADNWFMGLGDYLMRAVVTSPSGEVTVTGYTIYRSNTTGGPYSSIGTSSTESYTDMSVVDGNTYYYVATANYSDGGESGYSNEDMAVPGTGGGGEYDTLHYDDGSLDYVTAGLEWGWECAVVFEPEEPCQLMALRYLVYPDSSSTGIFGVGMYHWTGSRISTPVFDAFPTIFNPGADGWTELDMSGLDLYFSSGFAASFVVYDSTTRLGMDDADDDYSFFYDPEYEMWFGADYKFYIQAVIRYLETGETYNLSGQVTLSGGTGGSPPPDDLSGSIVRVIETGDADTTDIDGNYEIELSSGVYTIEAWRPGYVPQNVTLGIEGADVIQNFSLIPYDTPLNRPRNPLAFSYLDGEVLLTWDPPAGYPGTSEQIYFFDPTVDTIRYMDSLSAGDIFDTRFAVWFPCTLTSAGIIFYSTSSYPDVSVHIWGDDGAGYPDLDNELIDSMVISPTPDSSGYVKWTEIDFSEEGLVIWPGQKIHLGVRLLSNRPSVTASSPEPTTEPPVSRYYSHSSSAWIAWGEMFEYIEVTYFSGESRRITHPIHSDRDYIPVSRYRDELSSSYGIFSPSFEVASSRALPFRGSASLIAPLEIADLNEFWIYHSESESGPYEYIGSVSEPDSFVFIHEGATNGILNYYYIIAYYDHGYSDPSDTVSALPLEWNDSAWVLLVDDDGSSYFTLNDGSMPQDEGIPLAQILLDIDVPFNVVELPPGYYIDDEDLMDYQAIIWNCGIGYAGGWTVDDSEEVNIKSYLDAGGKFALFSQDYIYDIYGATASTFSTGDFIYDYLGVSQVYQDAWTISGDTTGSYTGYDFAAGQSFDVGNPYNNWTVYADYIMSFSGDTMMTLSISGTNGAVGVTLEESSFQTAFLATTPFSMLDGTHPNTVEEFIRRLLFDYFDVHDPSAVDSVTVEYELDAGWHLLSIPMEPADNTTDNVFIGNSEVLGYDAIGDTFYTPATIQPGVGYFVLFESSASFEVTGVQVDTIQTELYPLWNLVGVPWNSSGTLSFDDASFTPHNFINNSFFGYANDFGSYYIPTEAEVGRGYWVAVSDDCTFRFPDESGLFGMSGKAGTYSGMPPAPPISTKPRKAGVSDIYPNPFNATCAVNIFVPEGEKISWQIRDISGKIVFEQNRTLEAGNHILRWDGNNSEGKDCPSGIYFMTIEMAEKQFKRRALLIK